MALIVACSVLGVTCGAALQRGPTELRAQRIVVVDESGREVGALSGTGGTAKLELHNLSTTSTATLSTEGEAALVLGAEEKKRVRIVEKSDLSALEVRDRDGKVRILIGISGPGKPKVILEGNESKLILNGSDGKTIWEAPTARTDQKETQPPNRARN